MGSCLALLALTASGLSAEAQEQAGRETVYQREVYEYPRAGRPDPFRPPRLRTDEATRAEELVLRGVIHDADPQHRVAILVERSTGRRVAARVGQRVGELRVLAIHPRRVDLLQEDGAQRRFSLHLRSGDGDGP